MKSRKSKSGSDQSPMKFDATLKELLQAAPPRLLQMLVGAQPTEILTVEFPKVQMRRPDFVARLKDGRIYHLEIQSDNDAEMAWRMLGYYPLIRRLYGQAPIQQVLYIGEPPLTMDAGIEEAHLSFRYELIDIRQFDSQPLLASRSLEDNMLSLLCRADDQSKSARQIFRKLSRLPAKIRGDRISQLLILSQLRNLTELILEEARAMTDLVEILEKNSVVQEIVTKATQKRESQLLTRLLETRFGKVPKWAKQKIAAADSAMLETWALKLLKAKTLEEVLQ